MHACPRSTHRWDTVRSGLQAGMPSGTNAGFYGHSQPVLPRCQPIFAIAQFMRRSSLHAGLACFWLAGKQHVVMQGRLL